MKLPPSIPLVTFPHNPSWGMHHNSAVVNPREGEEQAIMLLIRGAISYCNTHNTRYQSVVGEDYVLGPAVADILAAIRTLLNGEIGRLDAGTIDKWCLEMARYHELTEHESLRD